MPITPKAIIPKTRPFSAIAELDSVPTDQIVIDEFCRLGQAAIFVFRGGFDANSDNIPSMQELMQTHRNRAQLVANAMVQHYDGVAHQVVEENIQRHFRTGTPEHLDGLMSRYMQAHTTIGGAPSLVTIKRHNMNQLSHASMQSLRERWITVKGIIPKESIAIRATDRVHLGAPEFSLAETLRKTTGSNSAQVLCNIGDTIVFPNGYDASEDSSPSDLFTHDFNPACSNSLLGRPSRIASISRMQKRPI